MKHRLNIGLLLMVWIGVFSLSGVDSQDDRQVWAFYLGFWAGADSWNWQADILDDYPAIGAYNSADPGVAGIQIDQAKSAGIDAFVVSWFGLEDGATTTPTLNNMLDRAAERGFQVGAAIDIFSSLFNRNRDALVNSLNWLVYDRANHPAYLRHNGKPVIFFAFQNRAGFTVAEWQNIRNQVDPDHNTIWIAEGISGCCIYGGAMDGMYAFNLAWANGSSGRYSSERNATLNAGGSLYIPSVHPGWNEDKIAARDGRGNPTSPRDRADGQFLANSFNGAVASGANVILIGTWNEFMENSHIEPSQLYGMQSLDTLRPLVAAWKGNAPPTDTSAPPVSEPAPGTPTLNSTVNLNVRPQPNTDGDPIGRISPSTAYAIVGEQAGWYAINYNGQTGWVSAQYVTVSNATASSGGAPASATSGRVAVMASNLNVRATGAIDGAKIGTAPIGSAYLKTGEANGWYQIDFGGQIGWVSGKYITIENR
jgi:uncharacterized protein YraI